MPLAFLIAGEELAAALPVIAAGASALIAYVGRRWWLQALLDVALRRVTNGAVSFPTMGDPKTVLLTTGAEALIKLVEGEGARKVAEQLLASPEADNVIRTHTERILKDHPNAHAILNFLTGAIPTHMSLPDWLAYAARETGWGRDAILHVRTAAVGVSK